MKERREKKERKEKEGEKEKAAATTSASPLSSSSSSSLPLLPHPNRATVASVSASCKGQSGGGASSSSSSSSWASLPDEEARKLALERWRASAAEEASREAARARAEVKEGLLRLFRSGKAAPLRIEHGTRWRDAQAALELRARAAKASLSSSSTLAAEEAEAEEAALFFASAPPSVALEAFEEHVRDLRRAWREQQQEAEAERLRRERRSRDAFRDLLSRRFSSENLTPPPPPPTTTAAALPPLAPRCRWREARRSLASEPEFAAVRSNLEGSTPRELFEAALVESERGFEETRAALLAAAAAKGVSAAAAAASASASEEERERLRSLFDAAADEARGAAGAASAAVRALVWSELAAGGRDAFWASRRRPWKGSSSKKGDKERGEQGVQSASKKKRGRRCGGDEDDGDGSGDEKGLPKHRRTRKRLVDEEEEEGQL